MESAPSRPGPASAHMLRTTHTSSVPPRSPPLRRPYAVHLITACPARIHQNAHYAASISVSWTGPPTVQLSVTKWSHVGPTPSPTPVRSSDQPPDPVLPGTYGPVRYKPRPFALPADPRPRQTHHRTAADQSRSGDCWWSDSRINDRQMVRKMTAFQIRVALLRYGGVGKKRM